MPQAPLLGTVDANGFIWTVPRQVFVRLYVATGDVGIAARDSKLPEGDDPEALLEDESIKDAIAQLHGDVLRRIWETTDTVTARYSNIAEGNVMDYMTLGDKDQAGHVRAGNIKLKDMERMPRHMQQRIKKLKVSAVGDNTNFEIELHDPMKANDMLAKLLGLDGDKDPEDAKLTAQQIHDFVNELDRLDDHYDDPDAEAPVASDGSDEPSAPGNEHPSDQDS